MKIKDLGGNWISFHCPGCKIAHVIPVKDHTNAWDWNGSHARPTLSPSILVNRNGVNQTAPICHFYIRDGFFEFLPDSTHELAGRVVEMQNA